MEHRRVVLGEKRLHCRGGGVASEESKYVCCKHGESISL